MREKNYKKNKRTRYSPSPNTSQLAARMKVRRTLRSLGARPSQPKRLLRRSRQGGLKGFEEFRKDTSELCSEELHFFFAFLAALRRSSGQAWREKIS